MEEFVILDKTYLPEMVKLYKSAFSGAPWNDEEQLTEYIKEKSGGFRAINYGMLLDGALVALSRLQ